ncbi:Protein LURP-one-related 8 [Abeliophyllum distichum]|uniref:Protein LURP-one-related 8 n=1 Tax=Abeliophyllum distichum TaxID=126358 RepID=A0ABD1R972_9LAMI
MSRIHPTGKFSPAGPHPSSPPSVFTLWKRSTMNFQGTDGFTVFDHLGKLAFRVENYARNRCFTAAASGGLLLMDGSGKPLLTVKPKTLSMNNQWNGYRGELDCSKNATPRLFTMRRPSSLIHTSACEAEIHIDESISENRSAPPDFRIEGSFGRRSCKITRGATGEVVAKMSRKNCKCDSCVKQRRVYSNGATWYRTRACNGLRNYPRSYLY